MPLTTAQSFQLSNADLEVQWLRKVSAISAPATLADLRKAVYGVNGELAYWAATSGLTPANLYSLADHKLAAMKVATGATGALADVSRAFYALNLP